MASYGMNDVKNGLKIIVDGYPCTIVDTEYVKPGKGQAFTRVKYRNLKTGRVVEMTMKSTDGVEAADVMDTDMEFLYSDGEFFHFMHPETHDQIQTDATAMQREVQLDNPTVSLEQTMVAMQKAQIGFQATLQVRNKLVQAYSDIMQMQV